MARARLTLTVALAFAGLLAGLAPSVPAEATTIVPEEPHDRRQACAAILRLIDNLNAGRAKDENELLGPTFYTDGFGKVEREEEAAFLHAMRNNEGQPDAAPIRLYHVYRVHRDRYRPFYLVVLERRIWREARRVWRETGPEADSLVEVDEPAHHYLETTYWLASFWSNRIHAFREANELYPMMVRSRELAACTSP